MANSITYIKNNRLFFMLIVLALVNCTVVSAAVITSSASGSWNAGAATVWSSGTTPTSSSNITVGSSHAITVDQNLSNTSGTWIFNGTVIDPAGGSAYTLTVANSASLTVNATFTMEGSATIKDNASLTVSGVAGTTMTVGSLTFKDNATINVAAGCSLVVNGSFTLKDNAALTLNGTMIVNGTATVKDHGVIAASSGVSSGSFKATGTISITGSASIFGSSSGCASPPCSFSPPTGLPIELVSFAATKEGVSVKVKWVTATEVNNEYFNVERSQNGATFDNIGKIKGAGNSSTKKEYSLIDDSPIEGNSYYRLKQTDFDGKNETFSMIAVYYEKKPNGECVFKVYPNPCLGQCNVALEDCDNTENPDVAVEVIDAAGNKVYSKVPYSDDKGLFNFQIDTENNLKPGIYIVRGANKKSSYAQKLIIK